MPPRSVTVKDDKSTSGSSFMSGILHRKKDSDEKSIVSAITTDRSIFLPGRSRKGSESETSSSDGDDEFEGRTDFVFECQNGEMVFVTSSQGRTALKSCIQIRSLLQANKIESDDHIIKKPDWSVATVRRLVELLTVGSTWIENDVSCFAELRKAVEELAVEIRLCSLINFYDTLDVPTTNSFFEMMTAEKYQFKIQASVKSWQWIELMKRGILLLLKSKMFMIQGPEVSSAKSKPHPSPDRLIKCDSISSEFCVYANGKINALLTIMEMISPAKTKKQVKARQNQQEEYKLIFWTKVGSMTPEDLELIWRVTSVSYTMASPEEKKYLKSAAANLFSQNELGKAPTKKAERTTGSSNSTSRTPSNKPSSSRSLGHNSKLEPVQESTALVVRESKPVSKRDSTSSRRLADNQNSDKVEYSCRTLTASSFMILKNLFDVMNQEHPDLPACLMVKAPTPDTLGRMINATQTSQKNDALSFDLEKNSYFALKSSSDIREMLAYLSDYSSSARLQVDFKLMEYQQDK